MLPRLQGGQNPRQQARLFESDHHGEPQENVERKYGEGERESVVQILYRQNWILGTDLRVSARVGVLARGVRKKAGSKLFNSIIAQVSASPHRGAKTPIPSVRSGNI